MKLVALLSVALGAAMVIAGGLAFTFGLSTSDVVLVAGFGPLDGLWLPSDYCFLGTILAAVGAGLISFSLAWVVLLIRHGVANLPHRQWIWISLVLLVGIIGVGVGVTSLFSQNSQKFTRSDVSSAQTQVAIFLVFIAEGKDVKAMTTLECQQRESSQNKVDTYKMASYRTTSTVFHDNGQITIKGAITSTLKTTVYRMEGIFTGGGVVKSQLDPSREIGFTARLVRGGNNLWLIDELMFDEA